MRRPGRPAAQAGLGKSSGFIAGLVGLALAGLTGVALAQTPALVEIMGDAPETMERLWKERLVVLDAGSSPGVSAGAGWVEAYVIFEQPLDRAFALLNDTARQREFRPELEAVIPVASLPDGSIEEHHMEILFNKIAYRLRYRTDPERRRITWQLDPSFANDLENVQGSWELRALEPGRTLAHFATRVDVGPAFPAFLEDIATRKNLPRTLEGCRLWVDADGH